MGPAEGAMPKRVHDNIPTTGAAHTLAVKTGIFKRVIPAETGQAITFNYRSGPLLKLSRQSLPKRNAHSKGPQQHLLPGQAPTNSKSYAAGGPHKKAWLMSERAPPPKRAPPDISEGEAQLTPLTPPGCATATYSIRVAKGSIPAPTGLHWGDTAPRWPVLTGCHLPPPPPPDAN